MGHLHIFIDSAGEDCFSLVGTLTEETRELLCEFAYIKQS